METTPNKKEKSGIGNSIFKIGIVLLMVAIVVLLLLQRVNKDGSSGDADRAALEASIKAKLGQLENKSEAEIQEELNRIVDEGMLHIAINEDPVFEDGESEGNLKIENVPGNQYTMRVEINLNETGELVYDSGLIDPNYHIQSDSLAVNLDAGQYPATATFYAYDIDTMTEVGTVAVTITLHILN